jgi:hypothetical protein
MQLNSILPLSSVNKLLPLFVSARRNLEWNAPKSIDDCPLTKGSANDLAVMRLAVVSLLAFLSQG